MGRWSGMLVLAAVAAVLAGCDSKEEDKKGTKHEHRPPHGGTLVEFGEEFAHLELVLDPATGRLTGYVLDGEAEKPARLSQKEVQIEVKKPSRFKVVLQAVSNALTGETAGDTSQFEGQSNLLKGLKDFDAAVVKISLKGNEFSGVDFNFPKGNEAK